METFIVLLIITTALLYVLRQHMLKKTKKKCGDCSATSCAACPIVTNSALQNHLKSRHTEPHTHS